MKIVDTDNPELQKNQENIQMHIALIELLIQRITMDEPTQEELQHFFNIGLSLGTNSN